MSFGISSSYNTPVIPAKAGIQSLDSPFPKVCAVDSRFRGNDCGLDRPCLANETAAFARALLEFDSFRFKVVI